MSASERWESRTEAPLAVAAFAFLIAYALPIPRVGTPAVLRSGCRWVITVTWVAFGLDYLVRLVIAERRWEFVKRNAVDLLVSRCRS